MTRPGRDWPRWISCSACTVCAPSWVARAGHLRLRRAMVAAERAAGGAFDNELTVE